MLLCSYCGSGEAYCKIHKPCANCPATGGCQCGNCYPRPPPTTENTCGLAYGGKLCDPTINAGKCCSKEGYVHRAYHFTPANMTIASVEVRQLTVATAVKAATALQNQIEREGAVLSSTTRNVQRINVVLEMGRSTLAG
jgi:hypothetical protein